MTYDHAIRVMQEARVHMPALGKLGSIYYALSRGKVIGKGATCEAALRDAGLWPQADIREPEERILFGNDGCDVRHGQNVVATARSQNYAHRIANALNAYEPNKKGY